MRWIRYGAAALLGFPAAKAGVYGWLPAMEGTIGAGGIAVEVDNSFADTLEQSDSILAFSGHVEAWRGDIGLFLDGLYGRLGFDDVALGPLDADATSELGFVELGGAYRFGAWPLDAAGRNWSRP